MDEIVVKYVGDISNLSGSLNQLENQMLENSAIAKKTGNEIGKSYSNQTAKIKETTKATEQQGKAVVSLSDKLKELANTLPISNQIRQVSELGSVLTSVGPAAQKGAFGVQLFSKALLLTGIPIVVAAIAGLIAYFKRTDEGATRLAGAMSAFNSVLDLITGSIIGFGEATFKAFRSIEDFKTGIADLGSFLIDSFVNRLKAPLTGLEALRLAIGGDFEAAALKFVDALGQASLGVTDITSKTSDFIDEAEAAALAAYEWEKSMDDLEDTIRANSVAIARNDAEITKLIISSKNKQIEDEKALGFLDKASKLEKENLAITLRNENRRLELIQQRNKRESDSINQDVKAGEKRRSINDDLAKEETDQIIKIIQLQQSSDNLLEKIQNRRDVKEEEIFQNQVKRVLQEEELRENAAKEQYINGVTSAEELEQDLYQIKLDGLMAQKELLVSNSRDIVDIDKAILDLELQNKLKSEKEKAALEKKALDEREKQLKEFRDAEAKFDEEQRKKREEAEKEHQRKLNAIKETGFAVADELASGFADIEAQKKQNELDEELSKSQKETDQKQKDLQKQFDNGLITEEQFNAKKIALDEKQAKKEAEIKKKKFEADKKAALIQIAIDTALSIAKAFAQLGPIGGALGAALAAAMGLAQAAIISAQPVPKFGKGGKVKGRSHAQGGQLIEAEGREWVIKKSQSIKHDKLLENINNDTADKFINSAFVVPAIERHDKMIAAKNRDRAKREKELRRQGSTVDMSGVERQLKKNSTVKISNISDIAKSMTKEGFYNSKLFS